MSDVRPDNSRGGEFVSLLFWLCLAVGIALYGVCALAPRVVAWAELNAELARNQGELVVLERHAQQLARVTRALESDPAFAAELARVELDAKRPGGKQIPLPPSLGFDPRAPRTMEVIPAPVEAWYVPAARLVASNSTLRWKFLGAAAGLLLFAFVFLQGDVSRLASIYATSRRVLRIVFGRYLREPDLRVAVKVGLRMSDHHAHTRRAPVSRAGDILPVPPPPNSLPRPR